MKFVPEYHEIVFEQLSIANKKIQSLHKINPKLFCTRRSEIPKIFFTLPSSDFHFTFLSFNNSAIQDCHVRTAVYADMSKKYRAGSCLMKFENKIDTYNKEVSKQSQIEPAIYGLKHILKKLKDVIRTSRAVSNDIGNLGNEQKKMLNFVVIFQLFHFCRICNF